MRPDETDRTPAWRRYLRFWRPDPQIDIGEEVEFHLQSRAAELVADGMNVDEARREAERRFGDVATITNTLGVLVRQRERHMLRTEWLDTITHDIRFGFRQLRKSPGFTAAAIATLALGIGATTAIFSVIDSVILRPLPYANSDRLIMLREGKNGNAVTYGNFDDWATRARSFEALAAYYYSSLTLTGAGEPVRLSAYRATAGYWHAMYIPPVLGAYYGADADRPSSPHVAVVSYKLWVSRLHADSTIVGKPIELNGVPYAVVAVAPQAYAMTANANDLWVPAPDILRQPADHGDHELTVIGLMRRGVSLAAANAEVTGIEHSLAREYPDLGIDGVVTGMPLRTALVSYVDTSLMILAAAVGLILLIGCGNVANLMLARGASREKELAVRGALGASRGRIIGQLLVEATILGVGGAVAGLVVATAGVHLLVAGAPAAVPRLQQASLDGAALSFATALGVLCGLAFGLVPALRGARTDIQQTLRDGMQSTRSVRDQMRAALIVCETALAVVLLVGAGLLVRSAIALERVPAGFDTNNLLKAGISLPAARYPTDSARLRAFAQVLAGVASIPGVDASAMASLVPFMYGSDCDAYPEGSDPKVSKVDANFRAVTPGYFGTLRVPMLRGRDVATADVAAGMPVVVINRLLATRLFGPGDAVGKRITDCIVGSPSKPQWLTVIGVAGDMHSDGIDADTRPEIFFPATQFPNQAMTLVVRGSVPVTTLTPAIRRAVALVDPLLPLSGISTMDALAESGLASRRFMTLLLELLGAVGLLLASVGIYGVIAYFVTLRTREIGIRMALGAGAGQVRGLVVRQGLGLAAVGIVIGLGASVLATRVLADQVFGVSVRDPLTFVAVAGLLGAVAVAASYLPARRATRIDPLNALRSS